MGPGSCQLAWQKKTIWWRQIMKYINCLRTPSCSPWLTASDILDFCSFMRQNNMHWSKWNCYICTLIQKKKSSYFARSLSDSTSIWLQPCLFKILWFWHQLFFWSILFLTTVNRAASAAAILACLPMMKEGKVLVVFLSSLKLHEIIILPFVC